MTDQPEVQQPHEERILILAPVGRDAPLMSKLLASAGYLPVVCRDVKELCAKMAQGAAAVLTLESLLPETSECLVQALRAQPPWSDFPVLLIVSAEAARSQSAALRELMRLLGHVTLLERPLSTATLVSAVDAALRTRRRQYQMRDLLVERTKSAEEIQRINQELASARDAAILANQAKSRFLAGMSHELRTPLNAIIGYAEMLEEDAQEAGMEGQLQSDLGRIVEASRHLLSLLNDVLDLSRIEAGKIQMLLERFDVEEVISEVEDIARPLALKNNNSFCLSYPKDLGSMHSDKTRVRQSLLNLVGNACKFTKNGEVKLSVWRTVEEGSEWVHFEVADTGVGVSPENLSRLFTEYTQVGSPSTRKAGGSGLGLAITRRFSEALGGWIDAQSVLGKGSSFTIHLPAEAGKQAVGERP